MTLDRLRLFALAVVCAFGALPATASAAEDPGPCIKVGARWVCPMDLVTTEPINIIGPQYEALQELYRGVEDDLNAYLCRQTGQPTYCDH